MLLLFFLLLLRFVSNCRVREKVLAAATSTTNETHERDTNDNDNNDNNDNINNDNNNNNNDQDVDRLKTVADVVQDEADDDDETTMLSMPSSLQQHFLVVPYKLRLVHALGGARVVFVWPLFVIQRVM